MSKEVLITFQLEGEGLAGKLLYSTDIFNKHREAVLYEGLQTVGFFLIWQNRVRSATMECP